MEQKNKEIIGIKNAKEKLETTPKKKRLAITLLASLLFPFIVFIATPALVFCNNISEFLFNWNDFLPLCSLLGLICWGGDF